MLNTFARLANLEQHIADIFPHLSPGSEAQVKLDGLRPQIAQVKAGGAVSNSDMDTLEHAFCGLMAEYGVIKSAYVLCGYEESIKICENALIHFEELSRSRKLTDEEAQQIPRLTKALAEVRSNRDAAKRRTTELASSDLKKEKVSGIEEP